MAFTEIKADISGVQTRASDVYQSWASGHADDKALYVRPYTPGEFYQRVDIARFEPEISLELAGSLGRIGMGELAYKKLSDGFEGYRVVEKVMDRHKKRESSLIPTLHLRDVFDTAMTHNNLFVTSGGDPELADINDVIVNPMMSHLNIGNMAVMNSLLSAGGVNMALPAEAAKQHGMTPEDIHVLERIYIKPFKKRIESGVVLNWSLPGTRAKKIITKAGDQAMVVSRVDDGIANIVRKRVAWAAPVPMNVRFGDCNVEVLEPRPLDSIEDVHMMMEEMTEVASGLSGEKIFYGKPEGAQAVQV